MITSQNLRTITDMRRDADGLLQLAQQRKEPIGILKNNKLIAYLLDARAFEKLPVVIAKLRRGDTEDLGRLRKFLGTKSE